MIGFLNSKIVLRSFLVLMMVASVNVIGFSQEEGAGSVDSKPAVSKEMQNQLAALLPDAAKMGVELDGAFEFYGENLYELINGAAGVFHDYGFVALGHAIYLKGDSDVTVDIYYMGEPLNAFGIFSAEGSPDYNFIDIGAAGYLEEGILNFLQGPYYVKLSAYGGGEEHVKKMLTGFAADVSKRMDGEKALPEILSLFPKKHLVSHSQSYSNKAPLGYQFLAPALSAEYAFGEDVRSTVVLSMAKDADDAKGRVEQMREQVVKRGEASDLEGYGPQAFHGKDKYRGDIIGFAQSKGKDAHYAVFVLKPPENADEILKEIQNALNPEKK